MTVGLLKKIIEQLEEDCLVCVSINSDVDIVPVLNHDYSDGKSCVRLWIHEDTYNGAS